MFEFFRGIFVKYCRPDIYAEVLIPMPNFKFLAQSDFFQKKVGTSKNIV